MKNPKKYDKRFEKVISSVIWAIEHYEWMMNDIANDTNLPERITNIAKDRVEMSLKEYDKWATLRDDAYTMGIYSYNKEMFHI